MVRSNGLTRCEAKVNLINLPLEVFMHPVRISSALARTTCHLSRHSRRNISFFLKKPKEPPKRDVNFEKEPKKIPEEITITLATGKLFEGQSLDKNYIDSAIKEELKKHLPKKITVYHSKQTSLSPSHPSPISSQPAAYSQPDTASNDFLLYYLLFRELSHDPSHCSYCADMLQPSILHHDAGSLSKAPDQLQLENDPLGKKLGLSNDCQERSTLNDLPSHSSFSLAHTETSTSFAEKISLSNSSSYNSASSWSSSIESTSKDSDSSRGNPYGDSVSSSPSSYDSGSFGGDSDP